MRDVRPDFPILQRSDDGRRLVYLDSAATSLKPQAVIDAVLGFYTHHTSNVHRGAHALAREATELFEDARFAVARLINADPDEIVFTHGTTGAIDLVRRCMPGLRRTVTTTLEHHSNFLPWALGDDAHVVPLDPEGRLDLDDLARALSRGADLVAVAHVSNALGIVAPVSEIITLAHDAGALVLVDGAQSVPHLPVDARALGADFLAFSAHKMLGPGGIGALYARAEHLQRMEPGTLGGDMVQEVHRDGYRLQPPPHRFEPGTPPIEAALGWAAAIAYLQDLGLGAVQAHDRDLVAYALQRLGEIDEVKIAGPRDASRRQVSVAFHVEGLEAHGVARLLSNRANVCVRSGFQCAQPAHESLDLPPTVRASFHVYNTRRDIDVLAEALGEIVKFL